MKLFRTSKKKPNVSQRVVADRSGYEISELEKFFGHSLSCSLYFYEQKRILAAPMTGTPGNIYAELREPLVLDEPAPDEDVGFTALQAMLLFDSSPVVIPAKWKATDWLTFQASGAKSLRAFDQASCHVRLKTVDGGGIDIESSWLHLHDSLICARGWVPISIRHSELGQLLRKLVRGARLLRDAGVF